VRKHLSPLLLPAAALLPFLVSCSGKSSAPAPEGGAAVARVDGVPISSAELDRQARSELLAAEARHAEELGAIRSRALEALIDTRLLEARARAAGAPVDELLRREVDGNVPPADEAELRLIWETTKANGKAVPPFEESKREIADFARQRRIVEARTAFVARLRTGARIENLLPPVLPPKVELTAKGPVRGRADAPVTIVEFSDYECPYCAGSEAVVRDLLAVYPDRVRLVFQSFPLNIHPRAAAASEAALCAGEQGLYWPMHDLLFAAEGRLGPADLRSHAGRAGVDVPKWDSCVASGRMAAEVTRQKRNGENAGVAGTPAFFVNGRAVPADRSAGSFRRLIDAELAAAGAR
jgi:protein-disulfide isomerase